MGDINKRSLLTGAIFIMIIALIFICNDLRLTASIISIIGSFVIICRSLHGWPGAESLDTKTETKSNIDKNRSDFDVDDPLPIISKEEIEKRDLTLMPIYENEMYRGGYHSDEYVGEKGPISEIVDSNILQEPMQNKRKDKDNIKENMDNYNKPHLLQRQWDMHESYNTPFKTLAPVRGLGDPEADHSMDTANTWQVRSRTRDQRCLTGATLKDANYFKRFYGEEFAESEGKPWWGREDW